LQCIKELRILLLKLLPLLGPNCIAGLRVRCTSQERDRVGPLLRELCRQALVLHCGDDHWTVRLYHGVSGIVHIHCTETWVHAAAVCQQLSQRHTRCCSYIESVLRRAAQVQQQQESRQQDIGV
jgi:hypothetical protein